ncbi:MAG: pantetheine-phosphate adenylyltransferase [Chloroflexi bacterium]|nr:pantetheine-phosphate adenylyltransferase [Chloroflexota bacterium]
MTIAVYPGSFDPITLGHVDIAARAAAIFERLVVAVFDAPAKSLTFTSEDRIAMAREALAHLTNVEVIGFHGLTVDLARRVGAQVIVRGLRAVSDFEVEMQMAFLNRRMAPEIEVVCLPTSLEFSYLSATMIKEIIRLGGPTEGLVPHHVGEALRQKYLGDASTGPVPRFLNS